MPPETKLKGKHKFTIRFQDEIKPHDHFNGSCSQLFLSILSRYASLFRFLFDLLAVRVRYNFIHTLKSAKLDHWTSCAILNTDIPLLALPISFVPGLAAFYALYHQYTYTLWFFPLANYR